MSIDLTNGVDTVTSGTKLTYTVTVENRGTADLADLRIEQQLPRGASAAAAGQRAKVADGKAVWTTDVRARDKTVLTSSATVGTERSGAMRAASTVCAYLPGSEVPVVCSSDMDLLPSGPQMEDAATVLSPDGRNTLLGTDRNVAISAFAGTALLAAGAVVALRRRRAAGAMAGGNRVGLG
jgi:uncharacterized repeat protein (TIGR01451 family)